MYPNGCPTCNPAPRRIREHIQYVEFLFCFRLQSLDRYGSLPIFAAISFQISLKLYSMIYFLLFNIFVIKWLQR